MNNSEIPMTGGNTNRCVVKVGDTVRRAMTPASPTIHKLLQHLELSGFSACPRFLGIDGHNREILTFIEGETELPPSIWANDLALIATADLLRDYHEATSDFCNADCHWTAEYPDTARHEVICHNDFAPYNLIFNGDMPVAMIDFDLAGPGPRMRDIAYAAYWSAPLAFGAGDLRSHALDDVENGSRRLKLFCRSYGIEADGSVLEMVAEVLDDMADADRAVRLVGREATDALRMDGHFDHWRSECDAFGAYIGRLAKNLE
ncbi:aminoglycoside phosphotransferase family protein [Hoeflea prorocentri]|uniref:Aminoglycoside phosphotransferase family protein n=1 Tax=Hoeflea prorocentri TaxID=1922333 RepID=A0A9X3ZGV0_9HYPH|nr:aminoglycoside phosphotransferase family protein [Hoeflea prorocentri]MCY6380609.1 aminoglycoside phosphotransferase family protein [Hoeflea prorocentri]MDA5398409.1 aminoglycoside phosphotransferase family protein [Hoeflea prorocentri]